MELYSKTKKIIFGIASVIINSALLYGTYTILFVGYIAWVSNLIVFYLHILVIILILFAIFGSKQDKIKTKLNKSLPTFVHLLIGFALVVMFIMAGWFYYAILCLVLAFVHYAVYGEVKENETNNNS